jgi:hypothetical protein
MTEIKLPSGRTLVGYSLVSGRAISDGSTAQMMHFVDDAKKDIAYLAALRNPPVQVPVVKALTPEECAALIDTMLSEAPWKDQMWARGALMIAARAIRRGRHLTASEKLENAFNWIEGGGDDLTVSEGSTDGI